MLRNDIPISRLIADFLHIPCKVSGRISPLSMPPVLEFQTATNPKTKSGPVLQCQKNFIPIDHGYWLLNSATSDRPLN
jgi:hypothetical protein